MDKQGYDPCSSMSGTRDVNSSVVEDVQNGPVVEERETKSFYNVFTQQTDKKSSTVPDICTKECFFSPIEPVVQELKKGGSSTDNVPNKDNSTDKIHRPSSPAEGLIFDL